MKRLFLIGLTLMLILTLAIAGCGGGTSGGDHPGNGGDPGGTTPHTPGDSFTYTVNDNLSFEMIYVPGASYPTGYPTASSAYTGADSVDNPFWLAQTEVSYDLCKAVYDWATSSDRGDNKYTFQTLNPFGGAGDRPVTIISWASAMVWCNALTEYFNDKNSLHNACVYCTDSTYTTPIRSVKENDYAAYIDPYVNSNAKGFRLPTCKEWELAARYQGSDNTNAIEYPLGSGTYWTPGDHVSGDTSSWCYSEDHWKTTPKSTIYDEYAWYGDTYANSNDGNSGGITHSVISKTPNALNIYNMSGNVYEWCFNEGATGIHRMKGRGGSYGMALADVRIGAGPATFSNDLLYYIRPDVGFRVAKSH